MYAETPKQFNKTYRILIAHTEQEIDIIIHMSVFSGNKAGFVRLGHNYSFYMYLSTYNSIEHCTCINKLI